MNQMKSTKCVFCPATDPFAHPDAAKGEQHQVLVRLVPKLRSKISSSENYCCSGEISTDQHWKIVDASSEEVLRSKVASSCGVDAASFILIPVRAIDGDPPLHYEMLLNVRGGIDYQHREGSKIGSGGQMSESQAALERKERLRKLALETIDISKDPYIIKNNLGTFECKLCLTVHPNEGNYLAHTQGKRHQYNLGRRAAMEAKNALTMPRSRTAAELEAAERQRELQRSIVKIGRPGYKVTKSRDIYTGQRALTFELEYPEVDAAQSQPRHRFMSAYEQKVETPDKNFQYLIFACLPYESIAFKIPNAPVDRGEGRFFTNWDKANKKFVLQLYFLNTTGGIDDVTN